MSTRQNKSHPWTNRRVDGHVTYSLQEIILETVMDVFVIVLVNVQQFVVDIKRLSELQPGWLTGMVLLLFVTGVIVNYAMVN